MDATRSEFLIERPPSAEVGGSSPAFWQRLKSLQQELREAESRYESTATQLIRCSDSTPAASVNEVWARYCQATDELATVVNELAAHVERTLQPD